MTSPIDRGTDAITTAARAVEDAFYVSVGAGVLAVQSAQVRRRELRERLVGQIEDAQEAVDRVRTVADDGLRVVERQVDEVVGHVEDALPGGPRELLSRSRTAGAEARRSVHRALRPAPPASGTT